MTIDQLHQEYGKLMIQQEILQNRIMECKKKIAEEMQKPRKPNVANPEPLSNPDAK